MLTVTDEAKAYLKEVIDQNSLPDDATIRLTANAEGLGLAPDQTNDEDTTFQHDGQVVLAVATQVASQLAGKTLSVNQTEQGPALSIT